MPFVPAITPAPDATPIAWSFAFVEGQLLLAGDAEVLAPGPLLDAGMRPRHYLGRLDGHDAWALCPAAPPAGWRRVPLRAAMMALPAEQAAVAARAAQLVEWDRTHRFCGVCAVETVRLDHERARRCPACSHTAYPRVTPAMMALVWRPGEVLLARAPHFVDGMYSALAGFVEAGETLEECVIRETAEEVGVRVGELRYRGSQSWPFPHSLMLAFTVRWQDGEIVPQAGEIADARWFPLDALPRIPPRLSIAGHLIRDTVALLQAGGTP